MVNKTNNSEYPADFAFEEDFSKLFKSGLLAQGWIEGKTNDYDNTDNLCPADVKAWLINSGQCCASDNFEHIQQELVAQIKERGVWSVLTKGFKVSDRPKDHTYKASVSANDLATPETRKQYEANILKFIPELYYNSQTNENRLDYAFFVNGIPVATVELKRNDAQEAIVQYKEDRHPASHSPILQPLTGALVHFAISPTEVFATTKLVDKETKFTPFHPVGTNSDNTVRFFWESVCNKENWLGLIHNFVQQSEQISLFPRYHQWRSVHNLIKDVQEHGTGKSYLIYHGPGSGKSLSIAWLARRLINLRNPDYSFQFDSVFVITDRIVISDQLNATLSKLGLSKGVIKKVTNAEGSKSQSLIKAVNDGKRIILVTLQTFPRVREALEEQLRGKNFAIIIDEAHSSQNGTSSADLEKALGDFCAGKASNLSFFAYTATPKAETFEKFGAVFDSYTMDDAITEGYILDPLLGYQHWEHSLKLAEVAGQDEADTKLHSDATLRSAFGKHFGNHPTIITKNCEAFLNHFKAYVSKLLNGQGKAMVITSSRSAAIRYKRIMDALIAKNPAFFKFKTLVAFSDSILGSELKHDDDKQYPDYDLNFVDDLKYTEHNTNDSNFDVASSFDSEEYQIMIVADKFQTGFDQPKLCALYVVKPLRAKHILVQTYCRVDRCYPGKDKTYIVDLINDAETVTDAFSQYRSEIRLSGEAPDRFAELTELHDAILSSDYYKNVFGSKLVALAKPTLGFQFAVEHYVLAAQACARQAKADLERYLSQLEIENISSNKESDKDFSEVLRELEAKVSSFTTFRANLNKFRNHYETYQWELEKKHPADQLKALSDFYLLAEAISVHLYFKIEDEVSFNHLLLKQYDLVPTLTAEEIELDEGESKVQPKTVKAQNEVKPHYSDTAEFLVKQGIELTAEQRENPEKTVNEFVEQIDLSEDFIAVLRGNSVQAMVDSGLTRQLHSQIQNSNLSEVEKRALRQLVYQHPETALYILKDRFPQQQSF